MNPTARRLCFAFAGLLAVVGFLTLAPLAIGAQTLAPTFASLAELATGLSLAAAGVATVIGLTEEELKLTLQLPSSGQPVFSTILDLKTGPLADWRGSELVITWPALDAAEVPAFSGMAITVQSDTDPSFINAQTTKQNEYNLGQISLFAAPTPGTPAGSKRIGLHSATPRYIRIMAMAIGPNVAPNIGKIATLTLYPGL